MMPKYSTYKSRFFPCKYVIRAHLTMRYGKPKLDYVSENNISIHNTKQLAHKSSFCMSKEE
jgi:hypothetical protein